MFVARLEDDVSVKTLVHHAWHVDDLKRMYEKFVKTFVPITKSRKLGGLGERELFIMRTRLIEMFRATTTQDPRIPDEVVGVNWKRREAIEVFQELHVALQGKATAYFRTHAVTGSN